MKLGIGVNLFKRREQKGTPIRDGLVAEYLFNEGRGQVLCDYSGNGNHGTLGSTRDADTNDPLWTPQGLQFDGVNDRVEVQDNATQRGMTELTLECVFTAYSWNPTFYGLICKWGVQRHYLLGYPNSHNLDFLIAQEQGASILSVPLPPLEVPVHLIAVFKGDEYQKMYYNAVFQGQKTTDIPSYINNATGEQLKLGQYVSFSADCTMHLARIYNRDLTEAEILENHNWTKTLLTERGVTLE